MRKFWNLTVLAGCFLFLSSGISFQAPDALLYVTGPCYLKFPEDHGPHPGYKTEWWYYTGNVADKDGKKFGFQLTFFRSRIDDKSGDFPEQPDRTSAWRTGQLILAHAALTDISEKRHYQSEKMARQALDMADVYQYGDRTHVFLKNWFVDLKSQIQRLEADSPEFSFELALVPVKKPVLHGDHGYSRKGSQVESASCYYSFTRLKAEGIIRVGSRSYEVDGFAWMDHEFSTNPLEKDLVGWDWFSIQLDNQTELMAYFLRKNDGSFSNASSATFVMASGETLHLAFEDLHLEAIRTWKSIETGAVYPSQWLLSVPRLQLRLEIKTAVDDQEMQSPDTTGVTYWEGSILVEGSMKGQAVLGKGYAELTGYAEPLNVPM